MLNTEQHDAVLWDAVRKDDAKALHQLFDRYWLRLYKTAFGLTRDEEISKEIVHDVFLNIWERRHNLAIESFPAFLLTAVRYQYYNRRRLARSPLVLVEDYSSVDAHRTSFNEGETRQNELELLDLLKGILLGLPRRCREIFLLSRTEHLSNDEIAGRLRISKRTVENQLSTVLHHLKSVLKNNSDIFLLLLISLWK